MRGLKGMAPNGTPATIVAAPISDRLTAELRPSGRLVIVGEDRSLDDPDIRTELAEATALLVSHTRSVTAELIVSGAKLGV